MQGGGALSLAGPSPECGTRRPSVGAAIITRNEEHSIERCLRSLSWVDEIVVVDDCSTDHTPEIARRFGCRVCTRPMRDFADQRSFALAQMTSDWVLHMDADEECTPELRDEILATLPHTEESAFSIPFRNRFLKREMRARDWSGKSFVRLARRDSSCWERPVHERLRIRGSVGALHSVIEHHGDRSYADRIRKSNLYTSQEARILAASGVRFRLWRLLLIPAARAMKSYVVDGGWRDGTFGLVWAGHVWWGNFAILVKRWELQRKPGEEPFSTGEAGVPKGRR